MKIPRTANSYERRAEGGDWWDGWQGGQTVHCADLPSHSPVLGPDGQPLKYEEVTLGFDLSSK